jgi:hypothetical protein
VAMADSDHPAPNVAALVQWHVAPIAPRLLWRRRECRRRDSLRPNELFRPWDDGRLRACAGLRRGRESRQRLDEDQASWSSVICLSHLGIFIAGESGRRWLAGNCIGRGSGTGLSTSGHKYGPGTRSLVRHWLQCRCRS